MRIVAKAIVMFLVWTMSYDIVGPTIHGMLVDERTYVNYCWGE